MTGKCSGTQDNSGFIFSRAVVEYTDFGQPHRDVSIQKATFAIIRILIVKGNDDLDDVVNGISFSHK